MNETPGGRSSVDDLYPDPSDRFVLEPDCRRCPSLAGDRECIAWGVGSRGATLVVVGEAPGLGAPDAELWRGGNHTGMAYTTRHSGRRIRRLFADLGYGPDELYFTNAVKCVPTDADGAGREPTSDERTRCRVHLEREIETIAPACIVTTGRHATETLLAATDRPLDGFVDVVLEPIGIEEFDPPVLPLLHPSYQDVWIAHLGYDPAGYREAIAAALADLDAGPAEP